MREGKKLFMRMSHFPSSRFLERCTSFRFQMLTISAIPISFYSLIYAFERKECIFYENASKKDEHPDEYDALDISGIPVLYRLNGWEVIKHAN